MPALMFGLMGLLSIWFENKRTKRGNMKNYEVTITEVKTIKAIVEADSEDEAIENVDSERDSFDAEFEESTSAICIDEE